MISGKIKQGKRAESGGLGEHLKKSREASLSRDTHEGTK